VHCLLIDIFIQVQPQQKSKEPSWYVLKIYAYDISNLYIIFSRYRQRSRSLCTYPLQRLLINKRQSERKLDYAKLISLGFDDAANFSGSIEIDLEYEKDYLK